MAEIGKMNTLKVLRTLDFGVILDGDALGDILLPKRYVPEGLSDDDEVEVFIYLDSEDRLIATTEKPLAMVDEWALLKVKEVNAVGAFLDWGLMKDLLVPFGEQHHKMEVGKKYIVRVYLDINTWRIVGSSRLEQWLDFEPHDFEVGQEVELIIAHQSELGYTAIINQSHTGIVYANEVFSKITIGDKIKGFIKNIRNDGKIDLALQKSGFEHTDELQQLILQRLDENEGMLPLNDKSEPDVIGHYLGCSKKAFKKSVGALYKKHLIEITEGGIVKVKK